MNAVDTNWLEAMFIEPERQTHKPRRATVDRYLRTHQQGPLLVSPIVALEARNVFTRSTGESQPPEWVLFENDMRFYRDPMNWDVLRRDVFALVFRYSHKAGLGTFHLAVLASIKAGGATRLLSFDELLKALAVAEGLEVFPPLAAEGKALLARLRS